ncbi:hypothetical protein HGRIS_009304 [Hohenbuehelia grisea]|uniref:Urease accessory protein UreF n=1 Tax=Hohenbuehelia grisea TaxID=104357 RepID=A0ABR3J0W0_9AGAR
MDGDDETYILLLLSDSNLPTGSFVASAGFESFVKHGFPADWKSNDATTLIFIQDSLETYARSALPFVSDAHRLVDRFKNSLDAAADESHLSDTVLSDISSLDQLYTTMTLNHVARRASKAQGVALLTLYSKGFSRPPSLPKDPSVSKLSDAIAAMLEKLKLMIRREGIDGHLPICWGVLTSALGLTLERSQYLHLFLHARSLLSASVRLNTVGPYGAQQLLLHGVRPLVQAEALRCKDLRTGILDVGHDDMNDGPAMIWPLGELLAARHDLQHSRIFNS